MQIDIMITHGWMTKKDAETIAKTLDLVCQQFPEGVVNTTELGVREGKTSRGIHEYLSKKGRINFHTGVDNQHDIPVPVPFEGCNLIIGNSIEVYNQIADNSQHFLFIDACHSYPMTMADFLVYSSKVRVGGYVAFHDCGEHIKPFTDYQGMGDKLDPDMYIACRKAVKKLGLLDDALHGWELVMDEADPSLHTGGIVVVKKLF